MTADGTPDDEADLWFLPPPPEPEDRPFLPRTRTSRGATLAEWRSAQGDLAAELAQLAQHFGALDERLRRAAPGLRQRLALAEAADLSWWSGDRVPADTLALWIAERLSGAQDDGPALARAAWAVRRLSGGPPPLPDLGAFLDRPDAGPRIADWCAGLTGAEGLHPFVQAAVGQQLWWPAGVSGDSAAGAIEGAVVAARRAASTGRGGAPFLPLAMGGAAALRGAGSPLDRLARWLAGADQAVLAAQSLCDRVEVWLSGATALLAARSGRTPALLLALFADWPFVSAPMAELRTGASRAAVQRNLDLMERLGLVREVTGQGRYRLWSARLEPLPAGR